MRDTCLRCGFEQASRSLDVYLVGLAKGARRTVDYGIDALYGRPQPLSREKVSSYGARLTTPAKDPCPDALGAETLYHTPAEYPRPSSDEDLRRVHPELSSLLACSSGGTFPSFSGLTTSLMVLMPPSATSRVTTLWGLPSPK